MNNKPLGQNEIKAVVDEYNNLALQGLAVQGVYTHIANKLGIGRNAVNRRIKIARANDLLEPNRTISQVNVRYSGVLLKNDMIKLEQSLESPPASRGTYRVLAIGDAHDTPALPDKSRFRWMGKLAQDAQPEYIVQIGDFADFDSLNSHVKNETLGGKQKTPFMADIVSLREAMAEFNAPINYHPKKHITIGNHENRAWRYQELNPEVSGMLTHQITSSFDEFGWGHSEYGAWHFIEGVGFTHAPFHGGAQPKSQSPGLTTIANKLLWDAVCGHTHKLNYTTHEKYGAAGVTTVNLGCALPQDYIFPYAEHSLNNWWHGCMILTIHDGRIDDMQAFSMRTLERHYG